MSFSIVRLIPVLLLSSLVHTTAIAATLNNHWINIPAGTFIAGSTQAEVNQAYRISAAGYGHDRVHKAGWFDHEIPRQRIFLPAFRIQQKPVSQAEYARFINSTMHPPPFVDAATWQSYQLAHPYTHAQRYNWHRNKPPAGKSRHPVVLVSLADAESYAAWLSRQTGKHLHLPSAAQWEKAMRGSRGMLYPWGNQYDATRLNNADLGPMSTMPTGSFPAGASPYGVLDGAGQVFEWTATPQGRQRHIVKGGSWDDHGGVCRPAAWHSRPNRLKHILIGFRLVELPSSPSSGRLQP